LDRLYTARTLPDFALTFLLFVLGAPPGIGKAPSVTALTQQATKLFRQKKYAEACPLFQQVTALAPERGAAWGDYGLCLARLGQSTEAIAATYEAIGLSGSDARARKAAYHNLGSILHYPFPSHIPGPTEEGTLAELEGELPRCEIFDAVPGCDQRAWACFSPGYGPPGLARFARDPRTIAQKPWPQSNAWVDPKTVLDNEVLVMGDGAEETFRSGLSICHSAITCRVVWADACKGRIGYQCDIATGTPDYDSLPEGAGEVPCDSRSTESGELTFK
jgi:hypothetical protein